MAMHGESLSPRRRMVSWHDPAHAAQSGLSMSGLDYLRALVAGHLSPPPMADLIGMRIIAVEPGRVTFTCEPDESTYNTLGVVHGGLACTLLDSAAGCALHSVLDVGRSYTSVEIKISYLKAIRLGSGRLTATGTVIKSGARLGFTEATLTDQSGTLLATATSTLLIVENRPHGHGSPIPADTNPSMTNPAER